MVISVAQYLTLRSAVHREGRSVNRGVEDLVQLLWFANGFLSRYFTDADVIFVLVSAARAVPCVSDRMIRLKQSAQQQLLMFTDTELGPTSTRWRLLSI